jgi:hypothetical protein
VRSLAESVLGSEARSDAGARQMGELLRLTRTALFKRARG